MTFHSKSTVRNTESSNHLENTRNAEFDASIVTFKSREQRESRLKLRVANQDENCHESLRNSQNFNDSKRTTEYFQPLTNNNSKKYILDYDNMVYLVI